MPFHPHKEACVLEYREGSQQCPYHVHDCENVRGDVTLAVLLHHLRVCHHEGFDIETLL